MNDVALDPHPSTLLAEPTTWNRFTDRFDAGQRPPASRHDDWFGGPLCLPEEGDALGLERR